MRWTFVGKVLKPVKTDMQPAPESRLKFVHCKCKSTTKSTFYKNLCSCGKHGLKCMVGSGECRVESCRNSVDIIEEDYDEGLLEKRPV